MSTARTNPGSAKVGTAMSARSPGGETTAPQAGTAGTAGDFTLALERRESGTAVLVLAGELDLYRTPEIEAALAEAIGPEPDIDRCKPTFGERPTDGGQSRGEDVPRLAVDLRSVTFIDSTTLALLLAASRRQHARRGELLVLVGPQTPMTAFEVTGFDRLLAIRRVEDGPRESGKSTAHPSSPEQEPKVPETRQLPTRGSLEPHEALRKENAQLRTALATRIVIEQAKGMLAERFDMDVDEAFKRLRREARNRRLKLHMLAAAVTAREAWAEAIFRTGQPTNATARRSREQRSRLSSPTITARTRTPGPSARGDPH